MEDLANVPLNNTCFNLLYLWNLKLQKTLEDKILLDILHAFVLYENITQNIYKLIKVPNSKSNSK